MPRVAARLFLRVTDVRVERVQDITEADAIAEGVTLALPTGLSYESYRGAFAVTWNNLNLQRGYPWVDNPFCWVYTFERISADEAKEAQG
jgi:hypothetical protein